MIAYNAVHAVAYIFAVARFPIMPFIYTHMYIHNTCIMYIAEVTS